MRIALSVDQDARVCPVAGATSLILVDVGRDQRVATRETLVPRLPYDRRIDLLEESAIDLVLCRSIDAAEAARLADAGIQVWAGQYALVSARSERELAARHESSDPGSPVLLATG